MKKLTNSLTQVLILGIDILLAWGLSSMAGISFDRALLLITLATVIKLSIRMDP